jgi:hypothetical protein
VEELKMKDPTKELQEQTAAVEGGTPEEPHDVLSNDGTVSHMVLHAGAEKKRKRVTATQRQIAANRANAARSTGPRTLEGKEAVARNAIKHGLTSRSVLLPGDDQREYKAFSDAMTISAAPQGPLEQEFVQQIIDAMWVRRRVPQIESGALRYLMGDEIDPAVSADLWSRLLDSLSRYAAAKDRVIFRAISELRRLQDRRMEELSYSPAQKMQAEQDQIRTVQKLIAELDGGIAGKANTNADPEASRGSSKKPEK